MQIKAIVLYGRNNERRILSLNTGKVNIITGKSKTGKSVIGDIIDYCFCSDDCNIAEGIARDHIAWCALQIIHNNEYLFIAREVPPHGQASTNSCRYQLGTAIIPENLSNTSPINSDSLKERLSSFIGINENCMTPPNNNTRPSITANIRHALSYCIQTQDEITSRNFLFHNESKGDFVTRAIKDTLPYFLGVIAENDLALEAERIQLKREAVILQKGINEVKQLKGNGLFRATGLLSEAIEIGLISDNAEFDLSDYASVQKVLQEATKWTPNNITITGLGQISELQNQLINISKEINEISDDMGNAREFMGQSNGYLQEATYQRNRLESIGLFEQIDFTPNHCPLCSEKIDPPLPSEADFRNSIQELDSKLELVSRETPRLQRYLEGLSLKRQKLIEKTIEIQIKIDSLYEENKEAIKFKDLNSTRARVIGRISLWLESVVIADKTDEREKKLSEIKSRIQEIEDMLSEELIEEKKESIINLISTRMSTWSKELKLEHSEYPYRFDIKKLTVVVDRDRPVPLKQIGSASNWLGCHLIVLFALHSFFVHNNRPVPNFLFLDQPSQAYFQPETRDDNVDNQELRGIYDFIIDKIQQLSPNMQVIIVDHADIDTESFQEAVIEKWWEDTKLVPTSWLTKT